MLIFPITFLSINCLVLNILAKSINGNLSKEINKTERNKYSHLNYPNIRDMCKNVDAICKSNNTIVCAMRQNGGVTEFEEFENSCYLFLTNMCVYPGEEFNIASSGSCESYKARRRTDTVGKLFNNTSNLENKTEGAINNFKSTTKPLLRATDAFSPLYELDTAYDFHVCPPSCPDIYQPECVTANRAAGKYFKFFTFVNHCVGDMYYCMHYEEFAPPPDEPENVNSSPLGWSYCGTSRYVKFAGFAEAASSMGHYGWLAGNHRYSHIMEPHERMPGYGKK